MRMFGLAGLVLVSLIVGLLAWKQMPESRSVQAPDAGSRAVDAAAHGRPTPQDVQRSLDAVLQAPRNLPDDAR